MMTGRPGIGRSGDFKADHGETILEKMRQRFGYKGFAPVSARGADEDHLFRRKRLKAHTLIIA
jgi:hypothetical protein